MKYLEGHVVGATVISAVLVVILACGCYHDTLPDYKADTYASLKAILTEKKSTLSDYFRQLNSLTTKASTDTVLNDLFAVAQNSHALDSYLASRENELDSHFVNTYGKFYDLLWVDTSGFVFHSIRQESDYRTCLFEDTTSTTLPGRLKSIREPVFVDFENYSPSKEPGAFHVVPIYLNDELAGWLIFQQAINRINNILTDRPNMGRTGEIYLVNSNNLMLSQSRFARESTILNQTVQTEAVRTASRTESGNLLIEDYRGVKVFSSFSRFEVLKTRWYIVAEINEAEVLTAHYTANKAFFQRQILDSLDLKQTYDDTGEHPVVVSIKVDVDMDEYAYSQAGQTLCTRGVATCTAVAMTFPGRFSCLAHVSPIDESYSYTTANLLDQLNQTDIVTRLMNRIQRYDIYPYELDSLNVTLVATHDESCWNIIDQLVGFGISLDRIRLLYKPDADYANVWIQADAATVRVEWIMGGSGRSLAQTSQASATLAELLRRLVS